jgi:hypothetical protein
MNQEQEPLQLNQDSKVYTLMLAGGMGARIIQTVFIRSLIQKRKKDGNNYPILVIDNSLIGQMVSAALQNQNVHGIQVPESHFAWPRDEGWQTLPNGLPEHPMFIEQYRNQFSKFDMNQGSLHDLIQANLSRSYQVEYGFQLTKSIHKNKHKKSSKSFIGNLYGDVMGLDYDGGVPMLKRSEENKELKGFIDNLSKPFVLMHLGVDRNPNEMANAINYRFHKVWSLQRWAELADALKDKYEFVQVYANQYNPEIPGIKSIKVDSLNPILQMLESPKCKFFMSIDNNLPHLAASIKKKGIVLWGSVSPYVWGWDHNVNIWNRHSCPEIACWRPGMYDTDQNGLTWTCPHYSCMRSIEVKQVLREVEKLEKELTQQKNVVANRITL